MVIENFPEAAPVLAGRIRGKSLSFAFSTDASGTSQKETGPDPVMELNTALKTIQILGQLLKNFTALSGETKIALATECYEDVPFVVETMRGGSGPQRILS